MIQMDRFPNESNQPATAGRISVGNGYAIEWAARRIIIIYRMGVPFRKVEIKAQIDKRRLAVEMVLECGAVKSRLAEALQISRQSLDNWIDTYKRSGFEGLVNSYKGGVRNGRSKRSENLPVGNKARILEEERRASRDRMENQQLLLEFGASEKIEALPAENEEPAELFQETYEFQKNRYAGSLLFWGIFQNMFGFMTLCEKFLGHYAIVVYLFVMMLVNRIESVEQLKVVFKREFGKVLGIGRLFSKPVIWEKIYGLCGFGKSKEFMEAFFDYQAENSQVGLSWLYIDGHFIPYYGRNHVHDGYYTQRDQMMPGQTQMYVHDGNGQVVYLETQEGKGDIREMMRRMSERWKEFMMGDRPLIIADRESWGVAHFISMKDYRFVTWEKFCKIKELKLIPTEAFGPEFTVNDIAYQAVESLKEYKDKDGQAVTLRRIVIWNKKSNRRMACVTQQWEKEDTIMIATAMLGRWGVSENSFKYMKARFNMHYNPLKDASSASERQGMANPEYKNLQESIALLKNRLSRCDRALGRLPLTTNKDGSLRLNKKRDRLTAEQNNLKLQIAEASARLKDCPERIEISTEDEKFRKIEVEGKNYWDLAQGLAWNSRKKLMVMFREFLPNHRDILPVLDAITSGHGWIRSTETTVEVLLEPLDTPGFRTAQCQLCRKLTGMKIKLHNGKQLVYSVGHAPTSV